MESWFGNAIKAWYLENKRDLPWRHVKDPYKIWLSEIILQQTQVVQGLSYYLKFIEHYPTVKHLAKAPEDEVLKLWQGLGYYSRARNLHTSAKQIVNEHKGHFPASFEEIKQLKGVGDYTAAAIASFAYDLPHAVVDGNVYRVLSRVFGIKTPIDTGKAKKEFLELSEQLLDRKQPALYNQAIMEFGSQFCKPVNPDCGNCILKHKCLAWKANIVSGLPIKAKKTKVRDRYFNYLVLIDKEQNVLIRKRPAGDIWQGLYEFMLIESETRLDQPALFKLKEVKPLIKPEFGLKYVSHEYKHVLSHQHLHSRFYVVQFKNTFNSSWLKLNNLDLVKIKLDNLKDYAFPRLTGKFLDDCHVKEML
jgi:A/G-specific adenine glycosylase